MRKIKRITAGCLIGRTRGIKNRPFQNGNKRIAVTTLLTMWITQSPPKLKKETVEAIEKFMQTYIIDLK